MPCVWSGDYIGHQSVFVGDEAQATIEYATVIFGSVGDGFRLDAESNGVTVHGTAPDVRVWPVEPVATSSPITWYVGRLIVVPGEVASFSPEAPDSRWSIPSAELPCEAVALKSGLAITQVGGPAMSFGTASGGLSVGPKTPTVETLGGPVFAEVLDVDTAAVRMRISQGSFVTVGWGLMDRTPLAPSGAPGGVGAAFGPEIRCATAVQIGHPVVFGAIAPHVSFRVGLDAGFDQVESYGSGIQGRWKVAPGTITSASCEYVHPEIAGGPALGDARGAASALGYESESRAGWLSTLDSARYSSDAVAIGLLGHPVGDVAEWLSSLVPGAKVDPEDMRALKLGEFSYQCAAIESGGTICSVSTERGSFAVAALKGAPSTKKMIHEFSLRDWAPLLGT